MPKYLNKTSKKKKSWGFLIFSILYAVIFLAATYGGLRIFWDFIEAYEMSRSKNTVNAYMEQLTVEDLCEGSADLIAGLDNHIQTPEECRQLIKDSIDQEITCAKLSSESSDTCQVYVLRCGSQVIGRFVISSGQPDDFGFAGWSVTKEQFDFSHLLGEPVSVTVPHDYIVCVNGIVLGSDYIVESGLGYEALDGYYEDYDQLPTMVTYRAENFLGTMTMEVLDPDGNAVSITEQTDMETFVDNCTPEELADLDAFVPVFLDKYVAFTGCANGSPAGNYFALANYLVPGSELDSRLRSAIAGLEWAQSQGDVVTDIQIHHYIRLDDTHYLCDITYLVDTTGRKGVVQTVNNVELVIVNTEDGFKVERIISY